MRQQGLRKWLPHASVTACWHTLLRRRPSSTQLNPTARWGTQSVLHSAMSLGTDSWVVLDSASVRGAVSLLLPAPKFRKSHAGLQTDDSRHLQRSQAQQRNEPSVPLYDVHYEAGAMSPSGREALQAALDASSVCWNCGQAGHEASACPAPRNPAAFAERRRIFGALRTGDGGPAQRYHNAPGSRQRAPRPPLPSKFQAPPRTLSAELVDALSQQPRHASSESTWFDVLPRALLQRQRRLGYPPAYLPPRGQVDERRQGVPEGRRKQRYQMQTLAREAQAAVRDWLHFVGDPSAATVRVQWGDAAPEGTTTGPSIAVVPPRATQTVPEAALPVCTCALRLASEPVAPVDHASACSPHVVGVTHHRGLARGVPEGEQADAALAVYAAPELSDAPPSAERQGPQAAGWQECSGLDAAVPDWLHAQGRTPLPPLHPSHVCAVHGPVAAQYTAGSGWRPRPFLWREAAEEAPPSPSPAGQWSGINVQRVAAVPVLEDVDAELSGGGEAQGPLEEGEVAHTALGATPWAAVARHVSTAPAFSWRSDDTSTVVSSTPSSVDSGAVCASTVGAVAGGAAEAHAPNLQQRLEEVVEDAVVSDEDRAVIASAVRPGCA